MFHPFALGKRVGNDVAIQAMRERGKLHLGEVQRRLESMGIEEGQGYSDETWEKALGPRLGPFLKRLTDDAIDKVDLSVGSLAKANETLCHTLKTLYPKRAFIKLAPIETAERS